jgi:tRNA pseudouridine38-40 synthase
LIENEMPRRLKLIVAYDGIAFAGWQSQAHRKTVQDELERAFYKIIRQRVRLHGAGRTDAGVHALAQCAHVDLASGRLSPVQWLHALNAKLPPTIRALRSRYVSEKFHARYSAKGKLYRYRIFAAPIFPPIELARAWHVAGPLDLDLLKKAGEQFVGQHDFAAFAANRDKEGENTTRTIWSVKTRRSGPRITIEIAGDGFLYKMVRLIVGAMAQVAGGKMQLAEIDRRLKSGRPNGFRFVAPPEGLYLVRVWY